MKKETSLPQKSSIINLLYQIEEHNLKEDYNKPTYRRYRAATKRLLKFYLADDRIDFSPEFTAQFVSEEYTAYKEQKISYATYMYSRRLCQMMNEVFTGNRISNRVDAARNLPKLSPKFTELANTFEQYILSIGLGGERVQHKSDAIVFLYFVFNKIGDNLGNLTKNIVNAFLIEMSSKRPGGISSILSNLKHFFNFLISQKIISEDFLCLLNLTTKTKHKIHKGFTTEEMDKILSAADRTTAIGKRDYAVLLLSRHTGLRACDIRRLKLTDIDWEQGELNICQSKTGRFLNLPISDEAADALADYILNARPKSDEQTIFLTVTEPHKPLSSTTSQAIVDRLSRRAGLFWEPNERMGIHSFRRSIAVNMLTGNVDLEKISEVLGHSNTYSTRPYISIDLEHLKICSESLKDFPCTVRCLK